MDGDPEDGHWDPGDRVCHGGTELQSLAWPEASELGARHGLVGVAQGRVGNEGQERDLTLPVVVCRGKSDVTACSLRSLK